MTDPQQADLFRHAAAAGSLLTAPLAARMRPTRLDAVVGQDHLVGPGSLLRGAIERGVLPSIILWGPPGTGKTTLASLIAAAAGAELVAVSAVSSGVADLRRAIEQAGHRRDLEQRRTILFIDEIHRFNKAQQDVVLPHVEAGTVTLIGATTENPSFEVNAALLSRCRVLRLNPLDEPAVRALVLAALADAERGLGARQLTIEDAALDGIVAVANGDGRTALTILELAAALVPEQAGTIGLEPLRAAAQQRTLGHDRAGDAHYDTISALIKSIRGSDPDAAIYWLARLIEAGEDPLFIVRRLVILAAEDVGLADPQALLLATACQQAVHFVGLPEGYLPLAETTLYLALAPKSNSAMTAYLAAQRDVKEGPPGPVPLHLRNAATALMRQFGYGQDYRYAHDFAGHAVEQVYLPDALEGRRYYTPSAEGEEPGLVERRPRPA